MSSSESTLCSTCAQIPIPASYFTYKSSTDVPPEELSHSLGTVQDLYSHPSCPLCRLCIVALGAPPGRFSTEAVREIECTLEWDTDVRVFDWHGRPADREALEITPATRCLFVRAEPWLEGMNESERIGLVMEDGLEGESKGSWKCKRWREEGCDIELTRRWLAECRERHDGCEREILQSDQDAAGSKTADLLFIDVVQRCLVEATSEVKYFTLSYVWGMTNTFQTLQNSLEVHKTPGALEAHKLPATIADAIDLVAKLGYRYLWIDSLCIVQDDLQNKLKTIEQMDLVYAHSVCTIVAGSGDGADSGLPSIRPFSRNHSQTIERVHGLDLMAIPHLDDCFRNSKYDTRAWTYQERQLSKRVLFFIGGQVFFQCQVQTWREDIDADLTVATDSLDVCENYRISGMRDKDKAFVEYAAVIYHYSGRLLTYEKDVLNAFRGVSKVLEGLLDTTMFWEMPVSLFDWAMLWEAKVHMRRRSVGPSWSWTGWVSTGIGKKPVYGGEYSRVGSAGMPTESDANGEFAIKDLRDWMHDHTWVHWYHYKDGRDVPELLGCDHDTRLFRGWGVPYKDDSGDCKARPYIPNSTTTVPLTRLSAGFATETIDRSGVLQFCTATARFKLGDVPDDLVPDEDELSIGSKVHGLYDNANRYAGHIWTMDDWSPPENKIGEVLILSEAFAPYADREVYAECAYSERNDEHSTEAVRESPASGSLSNGDTEEASTGGSDGDNADGNVEHLSKIEVDDGGEDGAQSALPHMWHLYNTMLVEEKIGACGIMYHERVGSGKVFREALNHSHTPGLQWKEIVLC